jgi:retron-type reverse transcriptase
MTDASTSGSMSPELMKVVERAQREPEGRFHSLAHLIDVPALLRAYHRIRKDGAVGVDGVTKEQYEQKLQENLENLHERLKAKQYRHQPIRRVHIPKDNGKTRPIGISAFEDRVVQDAIREVLQAIYEQDFLDCSHGFRPGRNAHDAIRALDQVVHRGEVNWVLEAATVSYFDSLDRTELMKLIQIRVADGAPLRLIGKCLHVGVLDRADYTEPEKGTIQGSGLSPLLGNIYLHYVLDLWFEREVKPRLSGKALHPDKTRLVPFRRPPAGQTSGKGPATFDFLGFTLHYARAKTGRWGMWCKTRSARLRRTIKSIADWCRRNRHKPVKVQHAALCRRIQGHYNYFGVSGNFRCLLLVQQEVRRAWFKWLRRRSQRTRLNWERYLELLKRFPLPRPSIRVRIWGA